MDLIQPPNSILQCSHFLKYEIITMQSYFQLSKFISSVKCHVIPCSDKNPGCIKALLLGKTVRISVVALRSNAKSFDSRNQISPSFLLSTSVQYVAMILQFCRSGKVDGA